MKNNPITSGWHGTLVADLEAIGGPATAVARPRQGHIDAFGMRALVGPEWSSCPKPSAPSPPGRGLPQRELSAALVYLPDRPIAPHHAGPARFGSPHPLSRR